MEEVVFMLQVKRSERGLESRPPSSFVSPDALLQMDRWTERAEMLKGGRSQLQALYVISFNQFLTSVFLSWHWPLPH